MCQYVCRSVHEQFLGGALGVWAMPAYVTMHRSRATPYHIDELMSVLCIAQGDVADAAVVRQLFQAVRETFDNRCTAFIHNAGLILGFSSKSLYE